MQFLFLVPNAIQESITEQIACQAGNPARLQLWAHLRSGPPPSPELGSKPRTQVSALRKRQLGEDPVPVFISTRTTLTPLSNNTEKTNKRKEKVRQGRLRKTVFKNKQTKHCLVIYSCIVRYWKLISAASASPGNQAPVLRCTPHKLPRPEG